MHKQSLLNLLRQNGRLVTEVRRHVTMVAKFLDHNNRELKEGEQLKSNKFNLYKQNINFARALRFFAQFLVAVSRLRHEIS